MPIFNALLHALVAFVAWVALVLSSGAANKSFAQGNSNISTCEKSVSNGWRSRLLRYVYSEGIHAEDGMMEIRLFTDSPDEHHTFKQTEALTNHFFQQFGQRRIRSLLFYPIGYETSSEKQSPAKITVGGSEGGWRFGGLSWERASDGSWDLHARIFSRTLHWLIQGKIFVSSQNSSAELNDLLYKIRELEPVTFGVTQYGPSYEPKYDLRSLPPGRRGTTESPAAPATQTTRTFLQPQLPLRLLSRPKIEEHIPSGASVTSLFSGRAFSENMISRTLRRTITVVDRDQTDAQKWEAPYLRFVAEDFLAPSSPATVAPADIVLLINPFLEGNTGIRFGDFAENLKRILDVARPYLKVGGKILLLSELVNSGLESTSFMSDPVIVRRPAYFERTVRYIQQHYPHVQFKKEDGLRDFLWPRDLELTTPARRNDVSGWVITLD